MIIVNKKKFVLSCIFFIVIIIAAIVAFIGSYPKSKLNKQVSTSNPVINKIVKGYKYKIVVDAGHGEWDVGTSYGKLYEKDLTLKIAKYAEEYLKSKNCEVIMTRDTDKVNNTCSTAKEWVNYVAQMNNDVNPDAFISIHINYNELASCKGVSTVYYYNEAGYQKEERLKLAKTIEQQMLKDDNWNAMGISSNKLVVLSKSTAVSALIECGFITNSGDRAKLMDEAVLKRLGRNISKGVLEYLDEVNGVKKKDQND